MGRISGTVPWATTVLPATRHWLSTDLAEFYTAQVVIPHCQLDRNGSASAKAYRHWQHHPACRLQPTQLGGAPVPSGNCLSDCNPLCHSIVTIGLAPRGSTAPLGKRWLRCNQLAFSRW